MSRRSAVAVCLAQLAKELLEGRALAKLPEQLVQVGLAGTPVVVPQLSRGGDEHRQRASMSGDHDRVPLSFDGAKDAAELALQPGHSHLGGSSCFQRCLQPDLN